MRPIQTLAILTLTLSLGCFSAHDDSPPDDDTDSTSERDLGSTRDGGGVDAFVACPPYPGPPTPEIRISAEEADCVGVTAADCAGCHARDEGWVLRPTDGGGLPPLGGIDFAEAVAECIPDCRFD